MAVDILKDPSAIERALRAEGWTVRCRQMWVAEARSPRAQWTILMIAFPASVSPSRSRRPFPATQQGG